MSDAAMEMTESVALAESLLASATARQARVEAGSMDGQVAAERKRKRTRILRYVLDGVLSK